MPLSSSATALSSACPAGTSIIDLIGYGNANCFEGTAPTPPTTNTVGALRKRGGCFDSNDNRADFSIAPPGPRNSAASGRSCDYTAAAIHDIQGPGLQTPFLNQDVTTAGIVTGRKTNGFFMQTPDAGEDGNPGTSQAIFVFTSAAPSVAAGDAVTVKGTATEFFNLTQLESTLPGDVVVDASGQAVPPAIVLTPAMLDPAGPTQQLERFEGMRMHAPALVAVAPTNNFGETTSVLPGVARPMREPGIDITLPVPPDPSTGDADCCIPRFDRNPERIMIDSDGLAGAQPITVTSHVTFSGVTGPLDFTFGDYKLLPETPPAATANISALAVPDPQAGEFTVAGFNIENFSNNAAQRQKAALSIREVMRSPDIIGHVEILNLESLQALADQVNADAAATGEINPAYQAYLIPASATATQNVGFLVKTSRIRVDSVTQEGAAETFINPLTGNPELLHDRPPLVLRATVDPTGADPRPILVVVNHLRSFIDIELVGGDGIRVRAKRTAQAESLARLLQDLQTANPGVAVISIGDYNAFEFNDGYTDPMAVIKGLPTPDDRIVVDGSPDFVDPNFINLTDVLPAASRYTFIFEGTPQALDHVLVNSVAHSYVQRYAIARANADFPEQPSAGFAGDPARPERSSDHDMPVAYFKFPARVTTTTPVPVAVTYDVDGQSVVLGATVGADGRAVSEGTVTFTVETANGTAVAAASAAVSDGTASATVTLPGTIEPQALVVNASFSGGPTTLPSTGRGALTVKYGICLLYDPARAVRTGANYPIRIQLCDASGSNVSSADLLVTALRVEGAGGANPDGEFRYSAKIAGYILNLSTTGLAPGVYNLSFVAGNDPTTHLAEFRLK
jgi:predicted extracellular nuclease